MKFWRFPASVLGHPQKIRAKIRATSVQTILASNPCRNPRKKIGQKKRAKNPCRKSVQKIRAKNPCKKSVQKIRAKNPCRKSVQKIRAKQTRANGFPKVTLQIENPKFYSNICSCCFSASCLWQLLRRPEIPVADKELCARVIHFHYRDRSVGMLAEKLSLQIQILP